MPQMLMTFVRLYRSKQTFINWRARLSCFLLCGVLLWNPTRDMEDTKIIYHIDDENTPYLVKLSVNADKVTLGDFKAALNRPNYKFFFKSVDADFGYDLLKIFIWPSVVKEEISDDSACLPCFNGRVIAWVG